MILFYSEFCPHCKMLLDTVKRHDAESAVRLISIEALKHAGKMPSTIHSVPALVTPENKKVMFGKAVFDFLLLPGSGVLLKMQEMKAKKESEMGGRSGGGDGGPAAFSLGMGLSSDFAVYEGANEDVPLNDRPFTWTNFNEIENNAPPPANDSTPYQEETRGKISLPDIEYIRQQRDLELRGGEPLVNYSNMPPATPTRIV